MLAAVKRVAGPLALMALFIFGTIGPAMAQRTTANQRARDSIERMERDIRNLQTQVQNLQDEQEEDAGSARTESFTSTIRSENLPATALLSERMDSLDNAVRGLTGEVEELQFLVNRLSNQLERVTEDFDYRLRALEGNLGPGEGAPVSAYGPTTMNESADVMAITPAPAITGNVEEGFLAAPRQDTMAGAGQPRNLGTVSTSRLGGSEEADFEIGMQLLRQGDFAGAETMFQNFISQYPDSDQLGESYFWLGESLYVRDLFADAATAYLTSARDFGDSTKAPDSLLKLGMSLAAMGQVDQACGAFNQVSRSYPDASNRVIRNVSREQNANNCS